MTEEQAILAAVHSHPREDTPRLVYSDWLEEHERPEQAAFIRRSRTGVAVDELRMIAKKASSAANQRSKYQANGLTRESKAAKAAAREAGRFARAHENEAAMRSHDLSAAHHEAAAERSEREGNNGPNFMPNYVNPRHHRAAAATQRIAAYRNEAVVRHLGSDAYMASDKAFNSSEQAMRVGGDYLTLPHERVAFHRAAKEAHTLAAPLQESEGNSIGAQRHRAMARYHESRERYWNGQV